MTQRIGPDKAFKVGEVHELCTKDNPVQEAAMDRFNNRVGISLGKDQNNNCRTVCEAALREGHLQVLEP